MAKKYVLPAVFKAVDQMSSTVSKMANNTTGSMDRMQRKWKKAGQEYMSVARRNAAAGLMIVAPMALVANEAVKFEDSMANVSTLIDTNSESIEKMGDKVLELSTKLPVPIDELTTSLYDIRSAGIAADDRFNTLETSAKLSAAGLSTVQESTDILTSALNAFESQGLSAEQTANILFKTVKNGKTTLSELSQAFGATAPTIQSAGVSLEDFSAAVAAITTTGTPASQAQNQLRASTISLMKPTAQMEKVYKKLGVTSGKELIQKYGTLGEAFAAVNKQAEKQNINLGKVWGSTESLAAVTSILGSTNEAYVNTLNDMQGGTDALTGAYEKQASTSKASMQILKNNLQSAAIVLGQALLPLITQLIQAVTPMIKRFANWAKRNKALLGTLMKLAAVAATFKFAMAGINFVMGAFTKVMGIVKFAVKAYNVGVEIATAVQWLWNAALNANPIGLVIIAVAALAAGVYALSKAWSTQTTEQKLNNEVTERALEKSIDQRVKVTMLFRQLRKLKSGTEEYNTVLTKIEKIQPGITAKYNLQAGAVRDLAAAEKELTDNILKRAESEARAELIKEKFKEAQKARDEAKQGQGSTGSSVLDFALWTTGNKKKIGGQYAELRAQKLEREAQFLADQEADFQLKEAENSEVTKTEVQQNITENTNEEKVMVEFANLPDGATVTSTGSGVVSPQLTSTR